MLYVNCLFCTCIGNNRVIYMMHIWLYSLPVDNLQAFKVFLGEQLSVRLPARTGKGTV